MWTLLALLLSAAFHSHWSPAGLETTPGDVGDSRFVHYLLEHGYRWADQIPPHQSYWDVPFFYPEKNVMAYSESLLGALPVYALPRWLGAEPEEAYRSWFIAVGALNFLSFVWLSRTALGLGWLASLAGAFLFAFSAARANQLNHPQLLPQFFTVLSLVGLSRLFRQPACWMGWLLFSGGFVAQVYAAFYLGWFYALGLTLMVGGGLGFRHSRESVIRIARDHARHWLSCGAVSVVALLPWLTHHLMAAATQDPRPYREVRELLPRLESWIQMGRGHWIYGDLLHFPELPQSHEHRMGIGLVALVLLLYGLKQVVVRRRRAGLDELGLSALVLCFLFLLTTLPAPYYSWGIVYTVFPGASAVRAVSRVILLLLIPIGILVAATLDAIRPTWLRAGLVALLLLEQPILLQPDRAYRHAEVRADRKRALAGATFAGCDAFYVMGAGDVSQPWWKLHADAIWLSLEAGVPTVNGYSGSWPVRWGQLGLLDNRPESAEALAALRSSLATWWSEHGRTGSPCLFEQDADQRLRRVGESRQRG